MPRPRAVRAAKWQRINSLDDVPHHVDVCVDYYRKTDEASLRSSGAIDLPKGGDVLRIAAAEFLTYWLFEDKNTDDPLARNYAVLADRVADALPDLKNNFEASGANLRALAKPPGSERAGDVATRLGVAVGLAISNRLFGLAHADWTKVAKSYVKGKEQKRLDYEVAAVGSSFVAAENKGSIVANNGRKAATVPMHKKGILAKKDAGRKASAQAALIGTIAVADSRDNSQLRCWLLDPPADLSEVVDAPTFKLLARLRFHAGLLKIVFPRWRALHDAISRWYDDILRNSAGVASDEPLRDVADSAFRPKWGASRKPQSETSNMLWVGRIGKCGAHVLYVAIARDWVEAILRRDSVFLSTRKDARSVEPTTLLWHASDRELTMLKSVGVDVVRRDDSRVAVTLYIGDSGFAFALFGESQGQSE